MNVLGPGMENPDCSCLHPVQSLSLSWLLGFTKKLPLHIWRRKGRCSAAFSLSSRNCACGFFAWEGSRAWFPLQPPKPSIKSAQKFLLAAITPPRPGTGDALLNNTTHGSPAHNFPEPHGPALQARPAPQARPALHARPASLHPTSHILHPASSHILHLASHISHLASSHVLHHRSSTAALLLNGRAGLKLQQGFWSYCSPVPQWAVSFQNVTPEISSLHLPFPS